MNYPKFKLNNNKPLICLLFILSIANIYSQCPSITLSSSSNSLSCNGPAVTLTAVFSPSNNTIGKWIGPQGAPMLSSSVSPVIVTTGNPETYTFVATNTLTSCSTQQTISITSSSIIPSVYISPAWGNTGFAYGCSASNWYAINMSTWGPAPINYTWTNVQTNTVNLSTNGAYQIPGPGNYIAQMSNGTGCVSWQPLEILLDSSKATLNILTSLSSNSFTLNCFNPVLTASAIANPTLPVTNFTWTIPTVGSFNSSTVSLTSLSLPLNSSTSTITALNTNGCKTTSLVTFYNDKGTPTYSITSSTPKINCYTTSVTFTPICVNATTVCSIPVSCIWTDPVTSQTTSITNPTFTNGGSYTLQIINQLNGCSSFATKSITKDISVSTIFFTGNTTICPGQTTTITASASGVTSYTWSTGATTASVAVSPTVSTTYTVNGFSPSNGCIGQNTVSINMCATDIEEYIEKSEGNFILYPNPAQDFITIKAIDIQRLQGSRIKILNSNGRIIVDRTFEDKINVSALNSGFYILVIESKERILYSKFIKN